MEPLTPEELRVVACLVEKQFTTPDSYPLTENAVVAACNQLSNRNPVVAYDNNTVRVTLTALRQRGMARVVHTPGARVPKHRQMLDDALELSRGEVSLLAVLALRGPQTVGELRTRTERMHDFAALSQVEETLEGLAVRDDPLIVRLERQPGQKEARYGQLLGGPVDTTAYAVDERPWRSEPSAEGAPAPVSSRPDRVAALEARVEALEAELAILRAEHGELREELGLGAARPAPVDAGPDHDQDPDSDSDLDG
jgi:uncharacterized protein YceH (UPF0502 family)